jgi:hypothetical protein
MIEINDTLRLDNSQGFPVELDIAKHLEKPYTADDFKGKVFTFKDKSEIRMYQQPPCRVFFVQFIQGKWLYWGLVQVLSITHDYERKTTGGTFKITYIYTPEEMKKAHDLIDRNPKTKYFED